jgi:phosphoribosyl-AMP cyclohydrolase
MTPQEASKPGRTRREGNITHIRTEFATRLRFAIIWQAQRAARAIVIRELKAAGIRTSLMSSIKLTRLTLDYLCRHRAELLAEAEASGVVQHLKHTHTTLEADIMRSYVVRNICAQLERRS